MDTSKKYIEMCKAAKEIQKLLYKEEYGNVIIIEVNYIGGKKEYRELLSGHEVEWLSHYGNGKKLGEWVSDYSTSDNPTYHGKEAIWLPRIDQLYKMLDVDNPIDLIPMIGDWMLGEQKRFIPRGPCGQTVSVTSGYSGFSNFCNSLEKLWLCFVMKEKYNKFWAGKEWVEKLKH